MNKKDAEATKIAKMAYKDGLRAGLTESAWDDPKSVWYMPHQYAGVSIPSKYKDIVWEQLQQDKEAGDVLKKALAMTTAYTQWMKANFAMTKELSDFKKDALEVADALAAHEFIDQKLAKELEKTLRQQVKEADQMLKNNRIEHRKRVAQMKKLS